MHALFEERKDHETKQQQNRVVGHYGDGVLSWYVCVLGGRGGHITTAWTWGGGETYPGVQGPEFHPEFNEKWMKTKSYPWGKRWASWLSGEWTVRNRLRGRRKKCCASGKRERCSWRLGGLHKCHIPTPSLLHAHSLKDGHHVQTNFLIICLGTRASLFISFPWLWMVDENST